SLLLEREVQVAALQALVDAAKSGGGRVVVVEGTAGIGQTRLLRAGRARATSGAGPPAVSPASFPSRCSRSPLRTSAPSCSQGRRPSPRRWWGPPSPPAPRTRPQRARLPSSQPPT